MPRRHFTDRPLKTVEVGFVDIRDGNPLKTTLARGGTAVGMFLRLPGLELAELCGHAGCDFLLIDMEHSTITWEQASAMVVAAESAGTVPVLRLSNPARDLITRALDIGAHGIMVAQVDSPDVARAVVAATRYGSGGTRGTAGSRRSGFGLKIPLGEFTEAANRATFVSVQIESIQAVREARAIAAVPGIDCMLAGLSDLTVDLGVSGQWDHPSVVAHAMEIQAACEAHGIAFGVPAPDLDFAAAYLARGARLIAAGDVGLFGRAIRSFVEGVRTSGG